VNENAWLSLKETVDILQCPVRSLRVQKVRDWYETKADDCPNDPELVPKVFNTRERRLDHGVITDPVRAHGEGCAFGAHFEGVDSFVM
jgi:hypothetical protein